MNAFEFTLHTGEIGAMKVVTFQSLMLMLYQALEQCENDQERNAVKRLIEGLKPFNK